MPVVFKDTHLYLKEDLRTDIPFVWVFFAPVSTQTSDNTARHVTAKPTEAAGTSLRSQRNDPLVHARGENNHQ